MIQEELEHLLSTNQDVVTILTVIDELGLADAWLCAGTIRNYVWNYLTGKNQLDQSSDVDIVFYDQRISYEETLKIEARLKQQHPEYRWELKNQVFMHPHNPNTPPYKSAKEAISKFPEKCTAIGARLNKQTGKLELFAPFGIEELIQFKVAPTDYFLADSKRSAVYQERMKQKDWLKKWPNLTITTIKPEAVE